MPVALSRPPATTSRWSGAAASSKRLDVKKEQNGLEVPRQLEWAKWQAGGEFVKVLCVKNVSTDVIKFSYRLLPSGSAFSVEYPEPRRLSPGMSATIKVAFRPSTRQTYTDELELVTGSGGSIIVPLSAVLPASKLQVPPAVDFGCVPVRQGCVQQLPITNVGDAGLLFSWKLQQPFAVVPATGQLGPGQTLVCEVHFEPQEAAAFRVAAACSLDNGELLTVQVSGMAKFPFLSLETDCIDMGDVVVGQTVEAFVRFGNHSPVPGNFFLAAGPGSHDNTITVQPARGTLQPNEYSVLKVTFAPRATGAFSCETFSLVTEGGNKLALTCKGTAVALQLRLSARVFALGCVRSGATPSKTLYLENHSDLPLHYQFLTEPGGVFTLTRPHGTVRPHSMAHTGVKFCGSAPGNYFQRIVCLVKDGEPQAIDVLASCYDDSSRPPTLSYKHIQDHLDRAAAGQALLPPSQPLDGSASGQWQQQTVGSDATAASATLGSDGGGSGDGQLAAGNWLLSSGSSGGSGTLLSPYQQHQQQQQQQLAGADSWQVLFEGLEAVQPAVTVSKTLLDFGCCSRLSPAEPQSFQVTNHTNAKLVVSLAVPGWSDPIAAKDSSKSLQQVFTAFPESLELRPQATGTFRVAFRPPRDAQYYCQTVMLLSSVKAMRSFRLVQDHQVVPPWSCALLACGNTFASVNPELSPKVSLSSGSISFPPCTLGQAVHQTVCLTNHWDTPVHFAFTARVGSASSSHASRFSTAVVAPAATNTGAVAGGDAGASSGGSGSAKAGLVAAGGAVFGQFAVLPVQGVLQPHSQHLVALRFKPCDLNPAELRLTCIFNHSAANSSSLLLCGTAAEPRLVWDVPDNRLFFRPTCVGAGSERQLTVRNASKVPVGWQWVLSRKLQDAVAVAPVGGVLRGFESVKVSVAFSPMKQGMHNARAALLLLPPTSAAAGASLVHVTPTALDYGAAAAAELDAGTEEGCQARPDAAADGSISAGGEPSDHSNSSSRLACEKLILTIVGEATQGALSIEPASLAFGDISVGYPQRKALRLINQSAGVLRYTVTVEDEGPPGGIDPREVACEFGSATAVLTEPCPGTECGLAGSSSGGSGGGGRGGWAGGSTGSAADDCWLDAPEGLVNARASKSIMLTLLPRRRGQYRLRLNLHAATVPQLPRGSHGGCCSGTAGGRALSASSACSSPGAATPPSAGRLCAPSATGAESPMRLGGSLSAANSPSPRGAGMLAPRHAKSASCSLARSSLGAVRLDDGRRSGSSSIDSGTAEALEVIRAARNASSLCPGSAAAAAAGAAGRDEPRAVAGDGSSGGGGCDGAGGGCAAGLLARAPLATAAVTADASFPSLLFTDVFCEGLPKQVSWQMLGLSQLNVELRCPVTAAEVQAQQLADKGQLLQEGAAALLPPFLVDLGMAQAAGRPRQIWVELSNDGVLPVEWELHSYDAPQVDLENWVEAARPLTQAEKERAFIIDNKVFEVLPRHGSLPAGEAQQVCLRFNPVAEGSYCLPLFLRIKDGKQLQLQLNAQAVAPDAQLALAVSGSHSCHLVAAPIGELTPPLQQYTLHNAGPAPLQYRLDTSPLQELAKQNYSADIIKYAGGSPLTGEVSPGGAAVFNWLFQPLEPKAYQVVLPLSLGGLPAQPLLIHGRGFHPTAHPEQAAPTADEAAMQWQNWLGFSQHPAATAHSSSTGVGDNSSSVNSSSSSSSSSSSVNPGPGRWLLCSPEVPDLGVSLPAGGSKQLMTLTNTAPVPVKFAWQYGVFEEQQGVVSGRLAITPTSGVLEPGEARVCQVSFQAGLQPQLFSGEVYCHAAEATAQGGAALASLSAGAGVGSAGVGGRAHASAYSPTAAAAWGQGLTLEQWQTLGPEGQSAARAGGGGGEGEGEDDDGGSIIIAQHPPRQVMPTPGHILRQRLPLHLSMTQSACNRFETLKQRYQQALTMHAAGSGATCSSTAGTHGSNTASVGHNWQQQQQSAHTMEQQQWVQPVLTPQLLTVTVQGAVLCKAHINAGAYLRPQDLQRARKLLTVAHLLPSVQQPVSLLPPPGALGPSAAAAKAAAAAAAAAASQQSQQQDPEQQDEAAGAAAAGGAGGADVAAADGQSVLPHLQAVKMAGAVLEELLADAWADEDVISAFDRLQPAPVPTYMPAAAAQETVRPEGGEAEEQQPQPPPQQPQSQQQLLPLQKEEEEASSTTTGHAAAAFAEFVLDSALLGALQEGVVVAAGVQDADDEY